MNYKVIKNTSREKTIGLLLITGATGVLIPYTLLTIIFDNHHRHSISQERPKNA